VQICFDDIQPILYRQLADRFEKTHAGIVDQNVQSAQLAIGEAKQIGNLLVVLNIGGFADDFTAALSRELANSGVDGILVSSADGDGATLLQ